MISTSDIYFAIITAMASLFNWLHFRRQFCIGVSYLVIFMGSMGKMSLEDHDDEVANGKLCCTRKLESFNSAVETFFIK